MNVVIFGASGMVGSGALLECLEDNRVRSVLVVGRSSCGVTHSKLQEVLHDNFLDFSPIQPQLANRDACFYCLGVSAVGTADETYVRITHDFAVAAAKSIVAASPSLTFCFISAQGADSSEASRALWPRTKGRTENAISAMAFPAVYIFRPGFIRPMKGVRSKTTAYQIIYTISGPIIPLLQRMFPNGVTTTVNIGRALIELANPLSTKRAGNRRILGNADINALA